MLPEPTSADFTDAVEQIARYRPRDVRAVNHNDVRAFVHTWFAAFDHTAPAEIFLAHLDDADMTFTLDEQVLASDHASFRTWYADALDHLPWDFHDILSISITGTNQTGWGLEFFFRHVGTWHDTPLTQAPDGPGRDFNRVLRATWRLEHTGEDFLIRRYQLDTAHDVIPL